MFTPEQMHGWTVNRNIGNSIARREAREKLAKYKKDGKLRSMTINDGHGTKKISLKYKSDLKKIKNGNTLDMDADSGHVIMKNTISRPKRYRGKRHYSPYDRKF